MLDNADPVGLRTSAVQNDGSHGIVRESIVNDFLKQHIPEYQRVTNGKNFENVWGGFFDEL